MASGGHQYTLVGFSEELDRRPLVFVEALPSAKVCSACGLVPNSIAFYPCGHSFCKPCYEQCERREEITCPLDADTCSADEVTWMTPPTRSILAKQVLCWNHRSGCNVVTDAADISRHFHNECGHHSATCPTCSAEILASDVCAHVESRCDVARVPRTAAALLQEQESLGAKSSEISDGLRQFHNATSMAMSSIQAELKEMSRTLKISVRATTSGEKEADERSLETRLLRESLEQMRIEMAKLEDQLDQFMQSVYANQQTFHNSFVEKIEEFKKSLTDTVPSKMDLCELATQFVAFREAIGKGQRESKAEFDRLSLAIDRQYDRMSELLRSTDSSQETRTRNCRDAADAQTESLAQDASIVAWAKNSSAEHRRNALALLTSIMPVATTHTWIFHDLESLKQRSQDGNLAERIGEPVYLRGYCVSVGVHFYGVRELCFSFELHQGQVDRYLEWPFSFKIRWSILHPRGTQKQEDCETPNGKRHYKNNVLRPNYGSRLFRRVFSKYFSTEHLESRDFIEDGRMLLR